MPYEDVNGARLYYEQRGCGSEAIVFAHGLLLCRDMYEGQIAALQDDYRCVAFDFRGHGKSESTRKGYSLDEFAQDAVELIRMLDCAPCHLVGHSLGGFVALRVALLHPELVKSLVLINTTAEPERREQINRYRLLNLIARFAGLRPVIGRVLPIMFGHDFLSDPSRAAERDKWRRLLLANDRRGVTRSTQAVINRAGVQERLSAVKVPTLVITGSGDNAIPPARSRALHEAIAKSRFLELPHVGHTSPVEAPDAIATALREFLFGVRLTQDSEWKPDRESEGEARPWLKYYGRVPATLQYPDVSLYEALATTAQRFPNAIAWDFFDTTATYHELVASIDACADAFAASGLGPGDRLLIAMPTVPQGVIAFYAANRLGAMVALIHPLSTAAEITNYLDATCARMVLTLDACYERFASVRPRKPLERLIVARISDYLSPFRRFGFWLAKGRKIPAVPADRRVHWWSALMAERHSPAPRVPMRGNDPAVIFFSGGTTGLPKGVVLSNRNLIAEGMQAAAWSGMHAGDAILAILPIFHGFGLGVCVNAAFMAGGKSILVPVFSAATVAKLLRTKRPNLLVGVPTLFDALSRDASLARTDLSCLRAAFSGADTLPRLVKERFEKLVADRGGHVRLLEGYGLTEAVTAIMAMPMAEYREGSVGIPFPDMLAKICVPDTGEELPAGHEGEICVAGPAVMLGYLDDPEATAKTLRVHADGRPWLHTGDLGRMDMDGFFYFSVRSKRMIKSSGFNVYPAQVEATLATHPLVAEVCVAGVPDPAQVERVKAFVVLKDATQASAETEQLLIAHCHERLIKWSCPREIEFRAELPRTRVGKIDYRTLVHEHVERHHREGT